MRTIPTSILPLACFAMAVALPAQDLEKDEAALNKKAAAALMSYAGFAKSKKVGPKAKEAYDLIIHSYDPDHRSARRALGFLGKAGDWKEPPPSKRKVWVDKADNKQRFDVMGRWRQTAVKLAKLHREFGLELQGGEGGAVAVADQHLNKAILYDPFDKEAHLALGHRESDGYYGTDRQIAFIKRMKDIETTALMLAKKNYPIEAVAQIPGELSRLKLEFHGAKSANFTIFTRGTQKNADDCVLWCERGLEFLTYCVGEAMARKLQFVERVKNFAWQGFLWTPKEKENFIKANPQVFADGQASVERAKQFVNINWSTQGGTAQVSTRLTPASMHDDLIVHLWHYALGGFGRGNNALLEGAQHAASWFLKATCIGKFGALPEGTVGSAETELPESANWWLRAMRDQALSGTDMPLNAVPRTRLWKFDNDARLKTWSFMTWCLAAYPDKWYQFVLECPHKKIPFPEEIDKIGQKVFGVPLAEVEDEWREWASGRGVTAAATGYGPPLLPERPNNKEIDGLTRLNQIRALAGYDTSDGNKISLAPGQEKWGQGLPECILDAEASMACKEHALFLGKHPEHHVWPEAHEEDPAKEGFSPRGMRAGMRSVIVINAQDSAECIDQWIGTVYHRFPLLQYYIKRIGFGFEDKMCVLDMASLEEPRSREDEVKYKWVVWPADGMKNVPRVFAFTEHPNPLEDVGLGFDDQKNVGYPISLQMSRHIAKQIHDASIAVFIGKKRGGKYEKGDPVECWIHTPDKPLLKRMELRDTVFAIPKAHLRSGTTYLCEVKIKFGNGERTMSWHFTTGSRQHGLGRL